ncbi:MAG: hypothetical protein WCK97_01215 [Actinomycetes bacterium]
MTHATLILAAEAAKSETPFFIIGVAFAAWAVIIGGIGTASESFPPSRGAGIAMGAVSVLLAAACMVTVLLVIG